MRWGRRSGKHGMKRVLAVVVWLWCAVHALAQIPYFVGMVGDGKLYGYSSVKSRPGINHQ